MRGQMAAETPFEGQAFPPLPRRASPEERHRAAWAVCSIAARTGDRDAALTVLAALDLTDEVRT